METPLQKKAEAKKWLKENNIDENEVIPISDGYELLSVILYQFAEQYAQQSKGMYTEEEVERMVIESHKQGQFYADWQNVHTNESRKYWESIKPKK
jgi:hypothetical protein